MKAIKTTYKGPTNCRGSRIIADDGDGNRVTIRYDCSMNSDQNHHKAATALCEKMNWSGKMIGGSLAGSSMAWVHTS